MSLRRTVSAVALAIALSGPAWAQTNEPGQDRPRTGTAEAIAQLEADTNGAARVGLHRATGAARFVRTGAQGRTPLAPPALLQIPRQDRLRDFLARHGDVFGIRDAATELFESRVTTDALENTHVTYQQRHRGVPVFAGELKAHFNNAGELTVVNGTFIPDLDVDPTPAHDGQAAANVAVNKVEGDKNRTGLRAAQTDLVVFRAGLAKGVAGRNHLAWRIEVGNGGDVREFVFIDAHTAKFIEQFTGIHDALNRRAFDGQGSLLSTPPNYPGTPFWVEGNAFPTASTEANNMILASGETHGLFMNAFGRDSFDGLGATMDAIFNRGNACPNASWNGTFISFCPGLTSDDVTGHEWAHAYTEYTHNLIYAWQPGALNESYSDIFGETVDRINARGGDTPFTARTAGSCSTFTSGAGTDNSVRWLLGEDDTGALPGALRDMWNPTCYGDPGKVTDTQYRCDPAFTDQGGVHSNSGVPNHAFALLVDGGTYNSLTVNPIGLTKAVHIYFRAMNVYQGVASDFLDHADAIEQSCTDLTGVNLADLSTGGASGEIISASDCTQVASAVLAVQLRTPVTTCSNFVPLLAKSPAALCEAGSTQNTALLAGFESGPAGWTVAHTAVVPADFTPRDWAISSSLPDGRAGSAFFGVDFTGGTCGPGGDESGVLQLTSPTVALPVGAAPRMTFEHWVATEADWDGGNVKVSVNGGPFTLIARAHYTYNPYNDTAINTTAQGNTNPLQGQAAFSGADGGSVDGSWGRSHVNLAPYANPGDNVQLRFDLGTDGCGGTFGWYIDDVSVHACVFSTAEISVLGSGISITDGDATPSATDHTNFGSADIAGGTVVRTFTVENIGAAALTLGALTIGGPHAADFTLTLAPTSPVAAPGTTTFQITFDPSALGPRSATVSLVNDDPDENPFDFSIEGIGFTPVTATVATVTEVEANGTTATAMALPLPSNAGVKVRANVYPAGDLDFYSFTATAGDRIYAATMTSGSAGSSSNSQLTLLGPDGTTIIEFDEDNGSLSSTSSSIAGAVIPTTGTYYIKVNDLSLTSTERGYDLYLQTRTGAPTAETESNDTPGTANTGITWASGNRNPAVASEQDWYAMPLAAGDTVFLNLDVDPERDGVTWNGRLGLALFGDAGNQILVVDDNGASDTRPSEAFFMTVKEAGTYFAFVDSATAATGGPTATYHLNMTVFPRVPVGVNTTTYTSTDVPKTIGPLATLVSSTITVPGNPRIALIRVTLDLSHTVMGQLDVHLRSPAGNDIGLFTDIGAAVTGGQNQMNTTFADEAAVTPVFTVLKGLILKPEVSYRLYWLNGEDAGGTWTLDIRDDIADANGGTLNGWSIEISEMPALPIGATIFSTDFETDDAGFTHSGTGDEWERGLPATAATNASGNAVAAFSTANSGTNAWKTDLDGAYEAFSDQDLFSPNIDLTSTNGVVTLSWAQRYQMESATFDHAYVEVQEVGGAGATRKVWEWLDATMSNAVGNPVENIGESAGWGLVRANISDFAGKTIRVRFHLDGDDSFQFAGWAIDDFSVTAILPPTVTTPTSSAVTATTATLGGDVTSDGGSTITERGVVYSVTTTNVDPLIGGTGVTKLPTSGTTGVFTLGATGLSPAAGYSFKAYAINAAGTGYTTVATFLTPPTITVGDVSIAEGNAGTTNAVFTVTLSGPSTQTVTVTATTSNLSATSGSDYTAAGPTVLTFAPGVVTQQFSVPITGDTALESDENFMVTLSSPTNGEILDGQATGTITNDDGTPPSRVFVSASGSDAGDCAIQTTPCRNLAAAVGKVSVDGEVIFLTPGEYDTAPILIGKGVKISAGSGTVAFIRQPITINAPGGRVSLRGLTLKGGGSGSAVTHIAADSVSLEEVSFDRWSVGLNLLSTSGSRITVANSTFVANAFGITDENAGAANQLSITGARFERSTTVAMDIYAATTTVSESAFVSNLNGILVGPGSADIRNSEFWGAGSGALVSYPGGALSLSRSHVFGNVFGLVGNGGLTVSFGNNVIRGNGTDTAGVITTVPEQ